VPAEQDGTRQQVDAGAQGAVMSSQVWIVVAGLTAVIVVVGLGELVQRFRETRQRVTTR
jgi:hypothetical protein